MSHRVICYHCGSDLDLGEAVCRLDDLQEWLTEHQYEPLAWTVVIQWHEHLGYLVMTVTPRESDA